MFCESMARRSWSSLFTQRVSCSLFQKNSMCDFYFMFSPACKHRHQAKLPVCSLTPERTTLNVRRRHTELQRNTSLFCHFSAAFPPPAARTRPQTCRPDLRPVSSPAFTLFFMFHSLSPPPRHVVCLSAESLQSVSDLNELKS